MDDVRYERLLDLIFDLKDDISEVKELTVENAVVLSKNTEDVAEHIRRTDGQDTRLHRLEKTEQMVMGFLKISGGALAAVAAIYAVVEVIQKLL